MCWGDQKFIVQLWILLKVKGEGLLVIMLRTVNLHGVGKPRRRCGHPDKEASLLWLQRSGGEELEIWCHQQ